MTMAVDPRNENDRSRATERHGRAVYVISVAAEIAGVHPQTLRIYERKGLVDPARTSGGSRRYSEADLDILRRISELTDEGLNLVGVKKVIELEAEIDRLEADLAEAKRSVGEAVESTHRQYRRDLVPLRQELTVFGRIDLPER